MSFRYPRGRDRGESDEEEGAKKRKIVRACDICRRRKHRCDGADTPDNRCSNCTLSNLQCTYLETSKRKATPKGYVESLEFRLTRMTELLTRHNPDIDLEEELGGPLVLDQASFSGRRPSIKPKSEPVAGPSSIPAGPTVRMARQSSTSSESSPRPSRLSPPRDVDPSAGTSPYYPLPAPHQAPFAPHSTWPTSSRSGTNAVNSPSASTRPSPGLPSSSVRPSPQTSQVRETSAAERRQIGKDADEDTFVRDFVRLNRPDDVQVKSFTGKSSGLPLFWSAIGFKYGVNSARYWEELALHPVSSEMVMYRTPVWEISPEPGPWRPDMPPPSREFFALTSPNVFDSWPDDDLVSRLVDSYFGFPIEAIPLLQKSHFLSQLVSRLYLSDQGFACLCFLVFAVGSLYLEDPRVSFPREDGGVEGDCSRGWIFYHASRKLVKSPLAPTDLYDLQVAVLLVTFLRVQTAQPRIAWALSGQGLRAAVDVGAHRRGTSRSADPIENELFKRAFWCLQVLDIETSGILGRPVNLGQEEYDATLDCNIEFWEDRDQQLPGEGGSRVEAFVLQIQLSIIAAQISSQLYVIHPRSSQSPTSIHLVQKFKVQLEKWMDSVPARLLWDPSRPNTLDFRLSANLFLSYENLIAFLHRPFLPSPQHPLSTAPVSMATTFEAAMECVRILDEYDKKTRQILSSGFFVCYGSALVLCLSVWGGNSTRGEGAMDPAIAMGEVEMCVSLLERYSRRFWGLKKTIAPIAVLAAPRVDYLAESVARRQARERKVAEAEAAQIAYRLAAAEMKKSPHSTSRPSPPILTRSSSASSCNRHLPLPSNLTGGGQSNFSESPNAMSPGGDFNLDFFAGAGGGGGDAIFGAMFPDFFTAGNDPSMTLFPGPPAFSPQPQPQQPPLEPHYHSSSSYSQPHTLKPILSNVSDPNVVVSDYGLASPSAWGGSSQQPYQNSQQQYGGYGNGNGSFGGRGWQQQGGGGGGP